VHTGLLGGRGIMKERGNLKDLDIHRRIILSWSIGWSGEDRIDLAQYRDSWRDVVKEVMNIQVL